MSEKVLLTAEQAEAIENMKNDCHWNDDSFINSHARNENSDGGESWTDEYHPLNKLSVSELAKVLYIGYEIEKPKFKAGDYVFVNWASGRDIHRVLKVNDNGDVVLDQQYPRNCHPRMELVQPTTTEEAYWLGELGRKCVGDFKDGDIYIKQDNGCYLVGSDVFAERASDWYEDDDNFKGIYPAESFRPYPQEESK